MAIRITSDTVTRHFQKDLQAIYADMARSQREITTQQRINVASDDPAGTAQVLGYDQQLADVDQYLRNISDSQGMLNTGDDALGQMADAMRRIRDLVVQAGNSINDTQSLTATAAEISQLKGSIRDAANVRFGSMYVFSGTATGGMPYPNPGNAYTGTANTLDRAIADGVVVPTNVAGPTIMGTTTGTAANQLDLLDLVDRIVADLTSGVTADRESARSVDLQALDAHLENVIAQRSNLGSISSRVEATKDQLGLLKERLMTGRSELADIDPVEAITRLTSQQTSYQAALAIGARINQTSLLDFI